MEFELRLALSSPTALPTLLAWGVLALVAFLPLARRFGWSPGWTLLALLSVAPVVAFTVAPQRLEIPVDAVARLRWYLESLTTFKDPAAVHSDLNAATSNAERFANLMLFVPAAFCATLATRWPVRVALAGMGFPFLIEAWQAVSDASRVASAQDWLYNSGGALAGVAVALLFLPMTRRPDAGTLPRARRLAPAPRPGAGPPAAPRPTERTLRLHPDDAPTVDLSRR